MPSGRRSPEERPVWFQSLIHRLDSEGFLLQKLVEIPRRELGPNLIRIRGFQSPDQPLHGGRNIDALRIGSENLLALLVHDGQIRG